MVRTASVWIRIKGEFVKRLYSGTSKQNLKEERPHMSKKAAHHRTAAEHHEHAARHHREAAKHHDSGNHEKAAHHAVLPRDTTNTPPTTLPKLPKPTLNTMEVAQLRLRPSHEAC